MLNLYVVVRGDLLPGAKAAQAAHALADLALKESTAEKFRIWNNDTIIILETPPNAPDLDHLLVSAYDAGFGYAAWREPDRLATTRVCRGMFGDERQYTSPYTLTSIAFSPDWLVQNVLLKDLPLALSNPDPKPKPKRWWQL